MNTLKVSRILQKHAITNAKRMATKGKGKLYYYRGYYTNNKYKQLRKNLNGCTKVSSKLNKNISKDLENFHQSHRDEFEQILLHRVPTIDVIKNDLLTLKKEFYNVKYHIDKLRVTTHDIVLRNINLGKFEILLPSPNSTSFRVTVKSLSNKLENPHPHVESNQLCLGEGRDSAYKAFNEFRLYDFFIIINNILRSYSAQNAYIRLECILDYACGNCNVPVSGDRSCSYCDEYVCNECYKYKQNLFCLNCYEQSRN